jgi:hypothetical protein
MDEDEPIWRLRLCAVLPRVLRSLSHRPRPQFRRPAQPRASFGPAFERASQ